MTPPRPLWKSVQDYVLIAIGMISYAIGWNVFLLPTNVTASGLPGISSIIYWATGCPIDNTGDTRKSACCYIRWQEEHIPSNSVGYHTYRNQNIVLYRLPQGSRRSHN